MPKKSLLLGGRVWDFLEGGGWKCQFCFYGRGDSSDSWCILPPKGERNLSNTNKTSKFFLGLESREPPLTLRQEKQYLYFGHLFPLYARAFFAVVRHFF